MKWLNMYNVNEILTVARQILSNNVTAHIVQLLTTNIVHFFMIIKIYANIAEIIISGYRANSNSILVDVMEYDMRSTRTSIVKRCEIEWCVILTKHLYKVGKED